MIQACLNGTTDAEVVATSPTGLATEAAAAVAAGAADVHVHPRDQFGDETLDGLAIGESVAAIRAACPGVTVGVSTGLWMSGGDPERRLSEIGLWPGLAGGVGGLPDHASVNVSEEGWLPLAGALLAMGVGVDAGVWTPADAVVLVESRLAPRCRRILIEPTDDDPAEALKVADLIDSLLDDATREAEAKRAERDGGVAALAARISGGDQAQAVRGTVASPLGGPVLPRRLRHGAGRATWPVLRTTAGRDEDTRIGFEDTLLLPDGTRARSNAELVTAALALLG